MSTQQLTDPMTKFLDIFSQDLALNVEPIAAVNAHCGHPSMLETEFRIRVLQRKPIDSTPDNTNNSDPQPNALSENQKRAIARQYQMIRLLQSFHDLQDILVSLYPRECSLIGIRMRPFWHHARSGSMESFNDCRMPEGYHQYLSQFLRKVVRLPAHCFQHEFIRDFFLGGGAICVGASSGCGHSKITLSKK